MPDTLPIKYAQTLLKLAGASRDDLRQELQDLNLPLVLLKDQAVPGASISVDDYGRLFIHLVRRLQPGLATNNAELDEALEFSAYRMMYLAMAHSKTLGQAMQRASVYFSRFERDGDTFTLEQNGERATCRFHFSPASAQRDLLAAENYDMGQLSWLQGRTGRLLSIALWHRQCGWFIGSRIDLSAVDVAQEQRDEMSERLEAMFAAPINYGASHYAFHFHSCL